MKFIFALFLFFVQQPNLHAQDVANLIKEADRIELIPNELGAFHKFKEILVIQPNNIYSLSKASELCSRIGSRETNTQNRDLYFAAALSYANKALLVDPLNDRANVAKAMALGKSTMTKSGKEKLRSAREIKKLCDIALNTNPSNYLAWHVLGKWHYEISKVGSVERAAAKLFFGGVPDGTLQNSIMYYEKARSLSPHFILNNVELAKAYHRNKENDKAIVLLKAVQTFSNATEDDAKIKIEALNLIKDYQ